MTTDLIAPGTIAHEALQFLRTQDGEVTTTALSKGIGRNVKRLSQYLSPAVKAGFLARRFEGGFAFYRVGPGADKTQPPAEPTPDELGTQRVIRVSAIATNSIFAYADQRKAAPFSAAAHTDGRAHVERHGRLIAEFAPDEVVILKKALEMVS